MKYHIMKYISRPIGESGEDKESCSNKYDTSIACKVCGTGAKLIGNLRTKGIKNIKKNLFSTMDGDIIISDELYIYLNKNNAKIGNLKCIVDFKGKQLPYFHLTTGFNLPKANEIKGLKIESQCPICKRNGYFTDAIIGNLERNIPTVIKQLKLRYNKLDNNFLLQSDVFNTWECLGLSNLKKEENKIVRYARPLLVVSENFKELMAYYGIKDLKFEPIESNLDPPHSALS